MKSFIRMKKKTSEFESFRNRLIPQKEKDRNNIPTFRMKTKSI